MSIFLLLAVAGAAVAATPCEDPSTWIASAERNVVRYFLTEAEADLAKAEEAFGCSALPDQELLARLWLTEGVLLTLQGDEPGSQRAFSAARRLAPDLWREDYGDELRARWEAAPVAEGRGRIELHPLPKDALVGLDGSFAKPPLKPPPGLHLVQVFPPERPAVFGRVVDLPPGEVLDVSTGLTLDDGSPSVDAAPGAMVRKRHTSRTLAIVGAATGLIAAGSLGVAASTKSNYIDGGEPNESLWTLNQSTGIAGYGLAATAGGLLVGAALIGEW